MRPAHPVVPSRSPGQPLPWLPLLVAGALVGCSPDSPPVHAPPGEPIPGLSPEARARFEAGRALFDAEVSAEAGLGPTFNQRRCSSCHDVPTLGGAGVEPVMKATRWDAGRCDLLVDRGGDHLQPRVTARFRALGGTGEIPPAEATHTTDLTAPALYGLGLVEAIPEADIVAREDSLDADGDGVSGRAGRTPDGTVARFGRKASHATLQAFVEGALLEEMGITTSAHPHDLAVNGVAAPPEADPAPDPEYGASQVDLLVAYVRHLAIPAPDETAEPGRVSRGRRLFAEIGCTGCHTPHFTTSPRAEAPLGGRIVPLYSDLLLHDLGPRWAGFCSAAAGPTELRTAPLAGLRHRPILTHDGRSGTLAGAIERHGGEAEASREAFMGLSPTDRSALLAFLRSL